MADLYKDIATTLANRRQRFYDEQPTLQAALSMQPINTRRDQNQTKGAIAGSLQALAKALMGAHGIKRAQENQTAYDRDFMNIMQSASPMEGLSADPRFAEVGSLIATDQFNTQRGNTAELDMYSKKAEIDAVKQNGIEISKVIASDPRFRRALADRAMQEQGFKPAQSAGIALDPSSPKQGRYAQVAQGLIDQGFDEPTALTQARAIVDADDTTLKDASTRIEKSLPGAQLADVQNTWKTLLAHKDVDTRAGDIAIIQAFARMNDPGSTVREGEFAIAQSAAPIFQKYMAEIESTIYGTGRLTPQTRKEMIESAALKIGGFQDSYNTFTQNQMQGLQGYPEDRLKTVAPFPIVDPGSYKQQIAGQMSQQPGQSPMAQPAAQPQANMPQMPAPNPQAVQQLMQAAPVQQGESFEQYRARIMGGGQ
jgi:hypothetical protein